jgi:hypothetical protein
MKKESGFRCVLGDCHLANDSHLFYSIQSAVHLDKFGVIYRSMANTTHPWAAGWSGDRRTAARLDSVQLHQEPEFVTY